MVKETGFYALLSRMRYISRWGLMRSSIPENVQEHSHETAVYAHTLGIEVSFGRVITLTEQIGILIDRVHFAHCAIDIHIVAKDLFRIV